MRQSNDIVNFRLSDKYLMIVPTMVNGAGPFNFLLDTGATHTVIDPALARQLQLPMIGEASLTTVSDVRQDQLVRLKRVAVGNFESRNWERLSINWIRSSSRLQAFAVCWARIFSRTSIF